MQTAANDRRKLANGWTVKFTRDWMRACRWAARYCLRQYKLPWHANKISGEYMSARNGYLAGYKARGESKAPHATLRERPCVGMGSRSTRSVNAWGRPVKLSTWFSWGAREPRSR